MRKFFRGVWVILSAPFRALWWIVSLPFRLVKKGIDFLNEDPSEQSLSDMFVSLTSEQEARKALVEEIEAFRKHLLRSVLWLAVGIIITASFARPLSHILLLPLQTKAELVNVELTSIQVTESLSVMMRIILLSGIIVAFPFIAFEFWFFAAPGLKPSAKRLSLVGIPFATALFIGGVAFSYKILVPSALVAMQLLNTYFEWSTQWTPDSYYKFTTGLLFWMGVGFEFPIVIWALTAMGIVKPETLKSQWRIAIVIIAVVAAMITPTVDPVTMTLVMGPLIVLYFVSIGLSYLAYRRKPESNKPSLE